MDKVTHFEIPSDDKERAKQFYSSVFDWQINDIPVQMGGAGGSVIEGRQQVIGMGYYAYVTDPSRNVIGLWENPPR